MRKLLIASVLLLITISIFGQVGKGAGATYAVPVLSSDVRDTIHVHDTVRVPVYFIDITDTLAATVIYKKSVKSDRLYTAKGFAIVRGFKTMENGKPVWVDKPQFIGALDSRKKALKNVIQVL